MYFVGLTMFNEKTNIHTDIQTYIFSFRQFGFYTTSKLKFDVCLPMPAVAPFGLLFGVFFATFPAH